MPLTSVTKDAAQLTLTVVADFPVSQQRLWDAYADPRQLERFWGPPAWPGTFTRHKGIPLISVSSSPDAVQPTRTLGCLSVSFLKR